MQEDRKRTPSWALMGMVLSVVVLGSCAGWERGCSSAVATEFGADWVVVQMDAYGQPFRCWMLHNKSIDNEAASDGIYWLSDDGNLVHVSGLYNRVQVENDAWASAFAEVGLTEPACLRLQQRRFDPDVGRYVLPDQPAQAEANDGDE